MCHYVSYAIFTSLAEYRKYERHNVPIISKNPEEQIFGKRRFVQDHF